MNPSGQPVHTSGHRCDRIRGLAAVSTLEHIDPGRWTFSTTQRPRFRRLGRSEGVRDELVNSPVPARNVDGNFSAHGGKHLSRRRRVTRMFARAGPSPGFAGDTPLTPRHSFGIVSMWEKKGIARIG